MSKLRFLALCYVLVFAAVAAHAQKPVSEPKPMPWNLKQLSQTPQTFPAPQRQSQDVQSLFLRGPNWNGGETRIFAWFGLPKNLAKNAKVPAVVLVHGGGGTAFSEWVRLWNARGYAAIAMDTCGSLPGNSVLDFALPRHEFSGPPGWGGFTQVEEPNEDQWTYHAVASVLLSHSYLRSRPEIDVKKIGITGVSWGGYLTCIAASIDARFAWAAPVYGCGWLRDDSIWKPIFAKMPPQEAARWETLWDPKSYLPRATVPFLWVSGTNDFAYPLGSLQKSYQSTPKKPQLAIRLRMAHAHGGPGENPPEILDFADSIVRGGKPLPRIMRTWRDNFQIALRWDEKAAKSPVKSVQVLWTNDAGPWAAREWQSADVGVKNLKNNTASWALPPNARCYFWNLTLQNGSVVSGAHQEIV